VGTSVAAFFAMRRSSPPMNPAQGSRCATQSMLASRAARSTCAINIRVSGLFTVCDLSAQGVDTPLVAA
jgi:hypothetical protein